MITDKVLKQLSDNPQLSKDKNFCFNLAAELHTFYIDDSVDIFEKNIMNLIGKSYLDSSIVLMPKQLEALHFIQKHDKCILSAPTSFGKSFLIMEHIKRLKDKMNLIIYVVHTVSLHQEVYNNFQKYFEEEYNVIDNLLEIDNEKFNIAIIISDGENVIPLSTTIDLLIIDEAYNLGDNQLGERYLNVYSNCIHLIKLSNRIILVGPFIKGVESNNSSIDAKEFALFSTDYSPVTAELLEGDKLPTDNCSQLFVDLVNNNQSTIFFINSKNYIYSEIAELLENKSLKDCVSDDPFIKWLESYFPSYWLLPKILKKGIALYHSSFPEYIKYYCMKKFNSYAFKGILTTSSILEGINTSAQNIVISDDKNTAQTLSSFRFFNLCGRAGRLNKKCIMGTIYNYSEPYAQRYEEKSLKLMIGLEAKDDIDAFNKGLNNGDNIEVVNDVKRKLSEINIGFDPWYKENKNFFYGDVKILNNFLDAYNVFKLDFKDKISIPYSKQNGISFGGLKITKKDGEDGLHKPMTLKYIYNNFIVPSKRKPKMFSQLDIPSVINDVITSQYGGMALDIKLLFEKSSVGHYISLQKDVVLKNTMFSDFMKIAFGYIKYDYYYANYILNEFIQHDTFFDDDEKELFSECYFFRIKRYLGENESGKLGNLLIEKGVIPPLIKRIIDYAVKTLRIDTETLTKKQLLIIVKNIVNNPNFHLTDHELINLNSIGLI